MKDVVQKLKDDSIALFVGILIGLPAWGILMPQIFAVISMTKAFDPSSLFKLFAICYFTIPFFIIFLLVIFQLKNDLFMKMRRLMLIFMITLCIVMIGILLMHSHKPKPGETWILYLVVIVTLLLMLYYTNRLIRHIGDSFRTFMMYPHEKTLIAINFSIFFLFIPIQWLISLLVTANHMLYNSWVFLIICAVSYFIPWHVYKNYWSKRFRGTQIGSLPVVSNTFMPKSLLLFPFLLLAILYFSGNVNRSGFFNLKQRESEYFSRFTTARNLVDTTIRELELMKRIMAYDSLKNVPVSLTNENDNLDGLDENFSGLRLLGFYRRVDSLEKKQKYKALKEYKQSLDKLAGIRVINATDDLMQVSREMQRTGIMLFVSTLLILGFILFMLFFKDDKYGFSENDEISRIRKIIGIAGILIAVLLLPLVKSIKQENIKPYEASGLFKLANWNLQSEWGSGDETSSPLDSLKRSPTRSCDCCVTVQNNFTDSLLIKATGEEDLSAQLEQIIELLAKMKPGEPQDSISVIGFGRLLVSMNELNALVKSNIKSVYDVKVTNPQEQPNLKIIEQQLVRITTDLESMVEQSPRRIDVKNTADTIAGGLSKLVKMLQELNHKESFLNKKTGSP